MSLMDPWFLLLLPFCFFASLIFSLPAWRQPLRLILIAVVALWLSDPRISKIEKGIDLWVLLDRSLSARDLIDTRWKEMSAIIEKHRGEHDRLFVWEFARDTRLQRDGDLEEMQTSIHETRMARAMNIALSQKREKRMAKFLILSDGMATDSLEGMAVKLREAGVAVDLRVFSQSDSRDYAITHMKAPDRVQPGQPFVVEAHVRGRDTRELAYELRRLDRIVSSGNLSVKGGRAMLRVPDRLLRSTSVPYELKIVAKGDPVLGNNRASVWVQVDGEPRVLLISSYLSDPVAKSLRALGFQVDLVTETRRLNRGALSGAKAVIINNVPAYEMPERFLKDLVYYVESQGGGLCMVGGRFSFGAGGYFESAVDPLLPVSMELKHDQRKIALAMSIVMDRSGSMGVQVLGGRTKMDLANEGAGRCVELLGHHDSVSIYAVDSTAHETVPLTGVANNRQEIIRRARSVESGGGGIFVYTGLKAAWKSLEGAPQRQKHVILFSDAADSEEPGGYVDLVKTMVANSCTVSVIGLGTDADPDAEFLKDIAKLGQGRVFFSDDPANLPALFAQETVAVARSAFIEERTSLRDTPAWLEFVRRPLDGLSAVPGYNLSYLRDKASMAMVSQDEYEAPLFAFWQRGAGRVAAVCFPLGGDFSKSTREWKHYSDFNQSLVRWLMGEESPPGLGYKITREGSHTHVDLFYAGDWQARLARHPPSLSILSDNEKLPREITWRRMQPGHYRSRFEIPPGQAVRGAIQVGKTALPFGPITTGIDPEWDANPKVLKKLKDIVRMSGGREIFDLSHAWRAPENLQEKPLRPLLLVCLLLLILLEVLLTRIGVDRAKVSHDSFGFKSKLKARPKQKSKEKPVDVGSSEAAEIGAISKEERDEMQDEARRQSRFQRTKSGSDKTS